MLTSKRKGQSILEYAMVLGLVVTGILIMQTFVKRGFQGGLKDSADKMGEQFSAGGTTTWDSTNMTANQEITSGTATTTSTTNNIGAFVEASDISDGKVKDTVTDSVYSYNVRTGGDSTMTSRMNTESAKMEKFRWSEHSDIVDAGDGTVFTPHSEGF